MSDSAKAIHAAARTYNGWTNYETWAVKLWIDNDHGSYLYWSERTAELWAQREAGEYEWQTPEKQAVYALAEELKDQHEEQAPTVDRADIYADLMNAALSEVNWQEIAQALIETAQEASA